MKKIGKGHAIKKWFLANRPACRRILTPTHDSFHIMNLDEIEDDVFYIVSDRWAGEIVIEEAEIME